MRDFDEVISLYFNGSKSLEERWSEVTEINHVPVASINFIYRYYKGVSITIPKSWIDALSDAWFTRHVEKNSGCSLDEDTLDWGVDKIDAERVWNGTENAVDIATGEPDGTGASILIIDTGWDNDHEDLSVDPNNYQRFEGENDDDSWTGHGTHVTGIINCQDNEADYIGVAPGATIYMAKAVVGGEEDCADGIIAALDWGIDLEVDIISMSLTLEDEHNGFEELCSLAYSRGILLVTSSGNSAINPDEIYYPAIYDTVMTVGATDSNNNRRVSSCYGEKLEIMAPGENIYSTIPDDKYIQYSGTSQACPMVAGVAALIKGEYPDLTGPVIREILINSTTDLNSTGWDQYTGYGLLNASAALDLAADYNQIMAEELAVDGDEDFFHVRTIHQIVHGTSGESSFPIYLQGNYDNILLLSQRMYFKMYMKVYYKDSWFKMWGWPPESGTDYYWGGTPTDMIEWSGSSFDYEKYPDGDLWKYRIGSDNYYFPYGCFSDGTSSSFGYSTETYSNGWTYLGYLLITSSGNHDVLLELDIDNTIAADYANGYVWDDLDSGIVHTVYIEKVYIKIVAEYQYYFFGWNLDKSIPITLGDGEGSNDYDDIDLASGTSPL